MIRILQAAYINDQLTYCNYSDTWKMHTASDVQTWCGVRSTGINVHTGAVGRGTVQCTRTCMNAYPELTVLVVMLYRRSFN